MEEDIYLCDQMELAGTPLQSRHFLLGEGTIVMMSFIFLNYVILIGMITYHIWYCILRFVNEIPMTCLTRGSGFPGVTKCKFVLGEMIHLGTIKQR